MNPLQMIPCPCSYSRGGHSIGYWLYPSIRIFYNFMNFFYGRRPIICISFSSWQSSCNFLPLNGYIGHVTEHLDRFYIVTQCACRDFLPFYSFLLGVQKSEYITIGPIRIIPSPISKCTTTFIYRFAFTKINRIKESSQPSKIRLFSIRRPDSVYEYTVGIRELFVLWDLKMIILIYQLVVSLFILTSPIRELISVRVRWDAKLVHVIHCYCFGLLVFKP
jgi:hypothetical protein